MSPDAYTIKGPCATCQAQGDNLAYIEVTGESRENALDRLAGVGWQALTFTGRDGMVTILFCQEHNVILNRAEEEDA